MEAYKWYGLVLGAQRRQLEALRRNPEQKPLVEHVCMPVVLGYFEVICPSEPTAYINHWKAAMKMLEMAGPEACRDNVLYKVFQIARLQMVGSPILQ
jgi:hypothetical protein